MTAILLWPKVLFDAMFLDHLADFEHLERWNRCLQDGLIFRREPPDCGIRPLC
jgi:hypothetical protein